MAWPGGPIANKYTPAGIQTSMVPTAGMRDANAVAIPKKIGEGTPLIQKPMVANIPHATEHTS